MSWIQNRVRNAWSAWLAAVGRLRKAGIDLIEQWDELEGLEARTSMLSERARELQAESLATTRAQIESSTRLYQTVRGKVEWMTPRLASVVDYFLPGHTQVYPSPQLPVQVQPGVGAVVTLGVAIAIVAGTTAVIATIATVSYLTGRSRSSLNRTREVLKRIGAGEITPEQGERILDAGGDGGGLLAGVGGVGTLALVAGGFYILYKKRKRT